MPRMKGDPAGSHGSPGFPLDFGGGGAGGGPRRPHALPLLKLIESSIPPAVDFDFRRHAQFRLLPPSFDGTEAFSKAISLVTAREPDRPRLVGHRLSPSLTVTKLSSGGGMARRRNRA